ncbi:MAG: hypothetical protein ACI9VR_000181 [Cognaticolwellia sp.]|jgi:hypothetical protein
MDGTLYLNPARQQFYLVPPDEPLADGVYFVIQVATASGSRWPASRELSRTAIEPFAIEQEQAREIIGDRLGIAAGGARKAFEGVLEDAQRIAEDRELPGGSAVRSLADRLSGMLATPQVEKGLSLLGNTLLDLADTMRERRGPGSETAGGGPSGAGFSGAGASGGDPIQRESELVLCPFCLSEVDDQDDLCETCSEELAERDPFVMTAAEYAAEPWKHCLHCGEDMLRLATVCASCKRPV